MLCLQRQVTSLVAAQDREFLSVYRVHMHGVHRELEAARMEALAAEEMLKDDKTVAALQAEHTWFQEECARLDTLTANMRKDLQYLRSRHAAVQAQTRTLSRQLKMLRRESQRMQLQRKDLRESRQSHAQQQSQRPLQHTPMPPDAESPRHSQRNNSGNWDATRTAMMKRQRKRLDAEIEALEIEWQALKANRSSEQELLEECVREVADAVFERKSQAIQPSRYCDKRVFDHLCCAFDYSLLGCVDTAGRASKSIS